MQLHLTDREGAERTIPGAIDITVMEAIRESGCDELLALCGGSKSCATCHVYVDPQWYERLPPMDADEDDLLDGAAARLPQSRLSCQIRLSGDLDGLRITLAPED